MSDLISILSEIRSSYNCFDEKEEPYYRALGEAIRLVSAQQDGVFGYVSDKEIADAPTVEAVPVIRCVDCVYMGCDEGATWCTHPRWVQLDGYCANGERREDETD